MKDSNMNTEDFLDEFKDNNACYEVGGEYYCKQYFEDRLKRVEELKKALHDIESICVLIYKVMFNHKTPKSFLNESNEYLKGRIGNHEIYKTWIASVSVYQHRTGSEMTDLFEEMIELGVIEECP